MILEQFLLSTNETNCYVIACNDTQEAAIIDPGEWNEQLAEFLTSHELHLKSILLTHSHHDHVGGLDNIREQFDVVVAGSSLNAMTDEHLEEGDIFDVGQLKMKVLETPGHTNDSLTFVIGCDVFCGDLMFAGSIGGTSDQAWHDLEIQMIREKIFPLGDDMLLHPGHGPATTVVIERLFNPLLIP
jgi:glyoxylase-like metal-dependent hydrolase (beta-lactamase superfamily II)